MRLDARWLGLGAVLAGAACGSSTSPGSADLPPTSAASGYSWQLPQGFPAPSVPARNPMSAAKVELGRHLFYDKRLSINGTYSCASCHLQARAFTDDRAQALGATGELHPRSAMSLANVAYSSTLTWSNNLMTSLEAQALVPMFGEVPVELGLAGREVAVFRSLDEDARYTSLVTEAYPGEAPALNLSRVTDSIASFERSLISGDSPYDRWMSGRDNAALSASAQRGRDLFFSERTECFHCHGGFNFGDNVTHEGKRIVEQNFHNNALYNIDGYGAYPPDNTGLLSVTQKQEDMGRFKAPSLRNIAVTAPYMHDGSIATLRGVVEHYARGGRLLSSGPYAGDGAKSLFRSEFVQGFEASEEEVTALVDFLESLTDTEFLRAPQHSDPWAKLPQP